jgi:hypothetical protein
VESTPEVVYQKINQEVFSPTDSLVTATSMEDLVAPDSSPYTSDNTPTAKLPHLRTSKTAFAHTPIQVGPSFKYLLFVVCVSSDPV